MHQELPDSHSNTTNVLIVPIEGHLRGTKEKNAIATHGVVRLRDEADLASSTNETPSIGEMPL